MTRYSTTFNSTSFDCQSSFMEEERWDILARGLHYCLDDFHEKGLLTKPVKEVTVKVIDIDKDKKLVKRFVVFMELEDEE